MEAISSSHSTHSHPILGIDSENNATPGIAVIRTKKMDDKKLLYRGRPGRIYK